MDGDGDGDGEGGGGPAAAGTDTDIAAAVRKLRLRPGAARTVVKVGGGEGSWLRDRNPLLGKLDLGKRAVYVCEDGACKVVGVDDL